jgi:hypothetical protein
MTYEHKLGIGFTLRKDQQEDVYRYIEHLGRDFEFSFAAKRNESIPHLTLFQGKFTREENVISLAHNFYLHPELKRQPVKGVSIFDGKIVFLDTKKTPIIDKTHWAAFTVFRPLCEGKPADPQEFPSISSGQWDMYNKHGYLFSLDEYLPHFTLAHLKERSTSLRKDEVAMNDSLLGFVPSMLTFDKFVVYRVGELGRCTSFAYERPL